MPESVDPDHYKTDSVEWRPVEYPFSHYSVSSHGMVINTTSGKMLKKQSYDGRYHHVVLYNNSEGRLRYVHRLVAEAFLPLVNNKTHVNHKDGNKKNNMASNLEWSNYSDNIKHAWDTGLRKRNKK